MKTTIRQTGATTRRRWVDAMTITTPATNYRCDVETLKTGAERIHSCVELGISRRPA